MKYLIAVSTPAVVIAYQVKSSWTPLWEILGTGLELFLNR